MLTNDVVSFEPGPVEFSALAPLCDNKLTGRYSVSLTSYVINQQVRNSMQGGKKG